MKIEKYHSLVWYDYPRIIYQSADEGRHLFACHGSDDEIAPDGGWQAIFYGGIVDDAAFAAFTANEIDYASMMATASEFVRFDLAADEPETEPADGIEAKNAVSGGFFYRDCEPIGGEA